MRRPIQLPHLIRHLRSCAPFARESQAGFLRLGKASSCLAFLGSVNASRHLAHLNSGEFAQGCPDFSALFDLHAHICFHLQDGRQQLLVA